HTDRAVVTAVTALTHGTPTPFISYRARPARAKPGAIGPGRAGTMATGRRPWTADMPSWKLPGTAPVQAAPVCQDALRPAAWNWAALTATTPGAGVWAVTRCDVEVVASGAGPR